MSTPEDLRAIYNLFVDALERDDIEGLSELFVEDAVIVSRGAPTFAGRTTIAKVVLRLPQSARRIAFQSDQYLEDGDLVVDIGTLLTVGKRTGRYVIVHRRQPDGRLKIAVDVPIGDS